MADTTRTAIAAATRSTRDSDFGPLGDPEVVLACEAAEVPRVKRSRAVVRGGYVVHRRGGTTAKLRAHPWPHEHGSLESAMAEAERLAVTHQREFCVFQQIASTAAVGEPRGVADTLIQARETARAIIRAVLLSDLGDAGADENADAILVALAVVGLGFAPVRLAAHVPNLVRLLSAYVETFHDDGDGEEPALQVEAADLLANLRYRPERF